jgi:hypothetical protein
MSNEQSLPATRECVEKTAARWEIQHYALCDGWVNAWTDSDENGDIPVTFDTKEEAEAELREFLEERPDEDESDYCIVSLDEHACGEIAGITSHHDPGETMFPCGRPAVVVGRREYQVKELTDGLRVVEDVAVYLCAEHSQAAAGENSLQALTR